MWDKYLEDTEQVFLDAIKTVESSGATVKKTINEIAEEWDLQIDTHIKTPWNNATTALQTTSEALDGVIEKFNEAVESANRLAQSNIATQKEQNADITDEVEDKFKKGQKVKAKKGTVAYNADGTKNFTVDYDSKYTVVSTDNKTGMTKVKNPDGKIRYFKTSQLQAYSNDGGTSGGGGSQDDKKTNPYGTTSSLSNVVGYGYTTNGKSVKSVQWALKQMGYNIGPDGIDGEFGYYTNKAVKAFQTKRGITADGLVGPATKKKFKIMGYAKGTKGVKKDQFALIDELGEELQLVPGENGRLAYIAKGTSIIPSDISENLMTLGQLDPSDVLNRNRPEITPSPSVVNNTMEINIDASVGTLLHVDKLDGSNPEEVIKIVNKAWEKKMEGLNNSIRRFAK